MELKEVLHFYLGCEVKTNDVVSGDQVIKHGRVGTFIGYTDRHRLSARLLFRAGPEGDCNVMMLKPIFRHLSSMTDMEAVELFNIGRGVHSDNKVDEIKRTSTREFYLRTGIGEYLFGWRDGHDNDVRVCSGLTFYIKRYYIGEELSVTDEGIQSSPSHFTPIKDEDKTVSCNNQTEIFRALISSRFDLFNLIPEGNAIDASTL